MLRWSGLPTAQASVGGAGWRWAVACNTCALHLRPACLSSPVPRGWGRPSAGALVWRRRCWRLRLQTAARSLSPPPHRPARPAASTVGTDNDVITLRAQNQALTYELTDCQDQLSQKEQDYVDLLMACAAG